jgi:hypothetical protein
VEAFGRNSVLTVKQGWRAVRIAVREVGARTAAAAMQVWRKLRSRPTMMVNARNAVSSVRRVSAASKPVIEYVCAVVNSFVRDCRICFRDCRMLFHTSKVSTAAKTTVDGNNGEPRSAAHRSAVAVFRRVSSGGSSASGRTPPATRAVRNKALPKDRFFQRRF